MVRNWCKTCENLVHIASTIGGLLHTKYLKLVFLDTFKKAISLVFSDWVTFKLTNTAVNIQ